MIRRPVLILAVAIVVTVGAAIAGVPRAEAQDSACSQLTSGTFTQTNCNLADALTPATRPSPGTSTISVAAPPGPTFVSAPTAIPCDAADAGGWVPDPNVVAAVNDRAGSEAGGALAEPGVFWLRTLVDPTGGTTESGFFTCAAVGAGPPAPPPPLPTADDIWGAALSTAPAVNLDPVVRGLTGLETYMWYEGATADSVALTLNGYGVTADIDAVEFGWDMGGAGRDGAQQYRTGVPGSSTEPAAEHTYAFPGPVLVVHDVVWTGTSVLTGPGLPAGGIVVDLGTADLATSRDYDVIEVRTPLVGGDRQAGGQ